jgi:cell division protein FtsI (penicillin-binding protein 3)
MKKEILILIVLVAVSCKNKEKSIITPKIEKELIENVYLNQPIKGNEYTVTTYVDSSIQKTSNNVLSSVLKDVSAAKGFVVVMETNNGKIKALSSLKKGNNLNYVVSNNLDIAVPVEPGSLIKTFDLMSLLEDKKADTTSIYDANGGEISYLGKTIKDYHLGDKKLTLGKAFLYSSNTVFAQAIDTAYNKDPEQFTVNFEKLGLNSDLGLPFSSNKKSIIPSPKSNNWSKISLPWMGVGYGLTLTPIQILAYYNAIANNGVLIKPLFLSKIETKEGNSKEYTKTVLNESICSKKTIVIVQDLLNKSTKKKSNDIPISGQSSFTLINYAKPSITKQYASTFVGSFPLNKPKYTIYVYIENPKKVKESTTEARNVAERIAESTN